MPMSVMEGESFFTNMNGKHDILCKGPYAKHQRQSGSRSKRKTWARAFIAVSSGRNRLGRETRFKTVWFR